MLPELGKYAAEVLSAYVASIALLVALIWATLRRGRKARAALDVVEREVKADGED